MFSPEEQQIEICLLKSRLEEIENSIMVQRSQMPALDADNEAKYRETMNSVKEVRALNCELERLKQENVRLTAKRMQLKQHCQDRTSELERVRRNRTQLVDLLKQDEDDTEQEIRKYEDFLRDIAERLRKTKVFFDEDQMRAELETLNKLNIELETEEKRKQNSLIELQKEFDAIEPAVPQDILDIVGQKDLKEKLEAQEKEYDTLCEKRDKLLNSRR